MLYLFFNRKHPGTGVTLLFFINFIIREKPQRMNIKSQKQKQRKQMKTIITKPKEKKIIIVETKEKTAGQEDIWILQE